MGGTATPSRGGRRGRSSWRTAAVQSHRRSRRGMQRARSQASARMRAVLQQALGHGDCASARLKLEGQVTTPTAHAPFLCSSAVPIFGPTCRVGVEMASLLPAGAAQAEGCWPVIPPQPHQGRLASPLPAPDPPTRRRRRPARPPPSRRRVTARRRPSRLPAARRCHADPHDARGAIRQQGPRGTPTTQGAPPWRACSRCR